MKAILLLLLALPGVLMAQDKELRLDVNGEIGIDQQGAVYDYKINTILTPEVKDIVDRSVRQWKFEPVLRDGKAVYAKTGMYLTLTALPVGNGYRLRVDDVRFVGNRRSLIMVPPSYPINANKAGVGAVVLVALRVAENGDVLDAVASQTQLVDSDDSEKTMNRWRKLFEASSVDAAKRWKFQPADTAAGDSGELTMIVPVSFSVGGPMISSAGWRQDSTTTNPIPWLSADKQKYDARGLKEGESLALDNPVRIKTSIVGTML